MAIVGISESQCGRGVELTPLQHQALAAQKALNDAGLNKSDVDAVMTTDVVGLPSLKVAEYLGIKPRFTDTTITGGSAFVVFVERAALAIAAGLCEVVLITYGSSLWSDRSRLSEQAALVVQADCLSGINRRHAWVRVHSSDRPATLTRCTVARSPRCARQRHPPFYRQSESWSVMDLA